METSFLSAMVVSVGFCLSPGVVSTEALRRGALGGFRPALAFQLGAMVGGAAWMAAGLAGGVSLGGGGPASIVLTLLSVALTVRLVAGAVRAAPPRRTLPKAATAGDDFRAGALLGLANPFAALFWLGTAAGVASGGAASAGGLITALAGVLAGSLAYRVTFAALIGWGRRRLTPATMRSVNALAAVALLAFAVRQLVGVGQAVQG